MTLFLDFLLTCACLGVLCIVALAVLGWLDHRSQVRHTRKLKAAAAKRARTARRYEILVGQIGGGRWN